jgi:hypothetical protein
LGQYTVVAAEVNKVEVALGADKPGDEVNPHFGRYNE